MKTLLLDVPKQCSSIVVLFNNCAINFNSTNQVRKYCEAMRLRINDTATQGSIFLITVQREDSSL
jgi:hypothetical protein